MAKLDFNDRVKREMIALQTEWKFDQEERERVEIGVSLKIAHQDYLDKVKQRSVDNYNVAVAHQELVDKQTKLLEERRASVRGWEREKAKLMQYKENGVAVAEDEDRLEEVQQQLDEAKKHYDSTVRLFNTNALVLESEAKTDFEKQICNPLRNPKPFIVSTVLCKNCLPNVLLKLRIFSTNKRTSIRL